MRKMFVGLMAVAFVVVLGTYVSAKTETVKGKIVDQACYLMDKAANAGKDHKMPKGDTADCAIGCAKGGKPMAILTEGGKLYELGGKLAADKNAMIIPHITHTVEVTGDVTEKDGKMVIAADTLKMISR